MKIATIATKQPDTFIDSTVFLGMHHENDSVRVACKNFFVQRIAGAVWISLENIGKCDDVVWKTTRGIQDSYYPFMDRLHTIMNFVREPYSKEDLETLHAHEALNGLELLKGLTLAMVISRNGHLYTVDEQLLRLPDFMISQPDLGAEELIFPNGLERWYQRSLKLRIK